MTKKDWEMLKSAVGPNIWSGRDLFKAFTAGIILGLLVMSPLALADQLASYLR